MASECRTRDERKAQRVSVELEHGREAKMASECRTIDERKAQMVSAELEHGGKAG